MSLLGDSDGKKHFSVVLRGGRKAVEIRARSAWEAEQAVRDRGEPQNYPIWYVIEIGPDGNAVYDEKRLKRSRWSHG
jgi:hypothetical protein